MKMRSFLGVSTCPVRVLVSMFVLVVLFALGCGGSSDNVTISDSDLRFSHQVGSTGCPQLIQKVKLTNDDEVPVRIDLLSSDATNDGDSRLLVQGLEGGVTLDPGESVEFTVLFLCNTTESFDTFIEIEAGNGDLIEIDVTATISR